MTRYVSAAIPDPTSPAVLIPFLLGMVGLFIAFQVYYWVGHKLGPRIYASRLGRRVGDERIRKAEGFVARWGALAVYGCFWVPGVRHSLPWVAGVLKISYPKYVAASALGCLTWCPVTYFGLYSVIWGWLALAGRSPLAAGVTAAVVVAALAVFVRRRRAATAKTASSSAEDAPAPAKGSPLSGPQE
ncbi:hypothetical protein GCM10010156_42250 [Planobispora rosea]|uniref:VTT domain-containing protein n=1 Tax=Planobispora rosea TaxID=35762 RepID=A0A8J3S6A3_PLARO|nr:VTT domain-containing protein [Planobispora rosea]GGS79035.1 hypothetical protein GCM10010156_42250 [Planobispora rosea]GIH85749.1 hypothetical protein Pro02_41570 [Planobispora rosea]